MMARTLDCPRHALFSCSLLMAVVASASVTTVYGQEAERRSTSADLGTPSNAELVAQLGADSFAVREQASRNLLRQGTAALVALKELPAGASLEQRSRARAIVQRIESDLFGRLATSFLLDADPSHGYDLPAWDEFRSLVGASRTSKLLFLDAVRHQRSLMFAIDGQLAKKVQGEPTSDSQIAAKATQAALELQRSQINLKDPSIGDLVALLLATSVIDSNAPVAVSESIQTNIHRWVFSRYLEKQGYGTCLRTLLSQWVPKAHDALATQVMETSLRHGIAEVAQVARRQLKANSDLETRRLALLCLSRFGDETDVDRILPFLDDQSQVHRNRGVRYYAGNSQIDESSDAPPGFEEQGQTQSEEYFIVQMNDIALAAIMLVSGEDPRKCFPEIFIDPNYACDTLSLATPLSAAELREQRISAWKEAHLPHDGAS